MTIGNIGLVFEQLGQYAKAREYFQKNIKVFTIHYGANHSKTKRVKRNLEILEEHVASKSEQKKPKAPLDNNPPKNDAQNLNDQEVFDID